LDNDFYIAPDQVKPSKSWTAKQLQIFDITSVIILITVAIWEFNRIQTFPEGRYPMIITMFFGIGAWLIHNSQARKIE